MKIKNSGLRLAVAPVCLLICQSATAWQQEYTVTDSNSPGERYTWDSERQPSYNDILEERIRSAQNSPGVVLNPPAAALLDNTSSLSIGWNIPLANSLTTGPVAAWHYDGSATSMYNEFGESATVVPASDPLWHANVSSLGWRVDSRFGGLRPWAQISYNQQLGENAWKNQPGLYHLTSARPYDNWLDLSLGAEMPMLNSHLAAYASLSQSENETTGQNYLYTLGVSAHF